MWVCKTTWMHFEQVQRALKTRTEPTSTEWRQHANNTTTEQTKWYALVYVCFECSASRYICAFTILLHQMPCSPDKEARAKIIITEKFVGMEVRFLDRSKYTEGSHITRVRPRRMKPAHKKRHIQITHTHRHTHNIFLWCVRNLSLQVKPEWQEHASPGDDGSIHNLSSSSDWMPSMITPIYCI